MKRPLAPTTAVSLQLPAAPPERLVGGRYTLGRMIGRGGNCEVHEATHTITGRRVALKLLRPEQREDRDARARLAQEARALASIHHPNFMQILDAEIDGQPEPFLALELLEGVTLEHVLERRTRLSVGEAVRWMRQITGAVAELHHAGWIHRDLKPANVLLVGEGARATAKVLDLGIAVAVGAQPDNRLTTRGTILGTVPYMAPEQVWGDGQAIDARTDVWQLGATLYDMLAGEVPFPGEYAQVLVQMSRGTVPSVRALRPDVPAALERIVARALALRPDDRFQDADALLAALVVFEASLEQGPDESSPTSTSRVRLRAQLLAPVRALLPTSVVDLRTEDICTNGLRVVGSQPLPEGATIRLRMALPVSGRLVNVPCVVQSVEVRRGPSGTPRAFAMCLEFDAAESELRREAAHYVHALGA